MSGVHNSTHASHLDGLSSEVYGPGTPVVSVPAAVENSEWRLAVVARVPRRATVVARAVGAETREGWTVDLPTSVSTPEAVLLGLADALIRLRLRGASAVTVLVTEKTLEGYLARGWQPRSLGMHAALTEVVAAAEGVRVDFEFASTRRR